MSSCSQSITGESLFVTLFVPSLYKSSHVGTKLSCLASIDSSFQGPSLCCFSQCFAHNTNAPTKVMIWTFYVILLCTTNNFQLHVVVYLFMIILFWLYVWILAQHQRTIWCLDLPTPEAPLPSQNNTSRGEVPSFSNSDLWVWLWLWYADSHAEIGPKIPQTSRSPSIKVPLSRNTVSTNDGSSCPCVANGKLIMLLWLV